MFNILNSKMAFHIFILCKNIAGFFIFSSGVPRRINKCRHNISKEVTRHKNRSIFFRFLEFFLGGGAWAPIYILCKVANSIYEYANDGNGVRTG